MNILKINFGKTLYFKRMELNLSQVEMAEKYCISPRQYIDLENMKRLPSFESLVNIIIKGEIDFNLFIKDIIKAGYAVEDSENK